MFGRKPPSSSGAETTADAQLLDMLSTEWRCSCCGDWHDGVMDLAAHAPDDWPGDSDYEPNSALRYEGTFLSEDFAVLDGKYFFVRSLIEIPIVGSDRSWGFGCWTTLSRANFDLYVAGFDEGLKGDEGPWFGWLSNRLLGYYDGPPQISVDVWPQPDRQRPLLTVQVADHPLGRLQRDGISAADLFALLGRYGHAPTKQ